MAIYTDIASDSRPRLARLAELELKYDGPIPLEHSRGEGLHALHQRLAAAARAGAARRRRCLPVSALFSDRWLARLTLTLAGHRVAALQSSGQAQDRR